MFSANQVALIYGREHGRGSSVFRLLKDQGSMMSDKHNIFLY